MVGKKKKLPRIAGSFRGSSGKDGPLAASGANASRSGGSGAVVAIYSVKGGVGKTTFAANMAWCAARRWNRRTLLWDLDAAGGSGFLYGLEPAESSVAEEVFSRERSAAGLIRATAWGNLEVLPADESIRAIDAQLMRIGKRRRLAKLTAELSADYERIVLDCPPVMNELSAQIIRAADLVVVPLPPSPLSARAFDLVVREIAGSSKHHPPILPVLSMLDLRRTLHREALAANPGWPSVPYASAIEQCAVLRQPVGAIAAGSPAAQAFERLWNAVEDKLGDKLGERS